MSFSFGFSQTGWEPSQDSLVLSSFQQIGINNVTLIPSKYDSTLNLPLEDWRSISQIWTESGISINALQGFFFGADYPLDVNDLRFPKTQSRFESVLSISEILNVNTLIVGSPESRKSPNFSGVQQGFGALAVLAEGKQKRVVFENLPKTHQNSVLANASELAAWNSKVGLGGMCLDLGNLFTWHTSVSPALKEMFEILTLNVVTELQFNLQSVFHKDWLLASLDAMANKDIFLPLTFEFREKDLFDGLAWAREISHKFSRFNQ